MWDLMAAFYVGSDGLKLPPYLQKYRQKLLIFGQYSFFGVPSKVFHFSLILKIKHSAIFFNLSAN